MVPWQWLLVTFLGGLYEDAKVLALAHAYQQATDFHLRRPNLDRHLPAVG